MSSSSDPVPGPSSCTDSSTIGKPSIRGRSLATSTTRAVVTSPPWAKDEPDSPLCDDISLAPERSPRPSGISTTRVPSTISDRQSVSVETLGGYHRWNFALPHPRPKSKRSSDSLSLHSVKGRRNGLEKRFPHSSSRPSLPRWPNSRKRNSPDSPTTSQPQSFSGSAPRSSRLKTLRLELPLPPPSAPFTLSHNRTPGWDSPWTPRIPALTHNNRRGVNPDAEMGISQGWGDAQDPSLNKERDTHMDDLKWWPRRKKKLRNFLLHNPHVPTVSRLMNITFTTATLAFAIRIRVVERNVHLFGAVGSSPILAIIFAPLTLVHVMIAIYLEFFGRPLGLWQTSAKLAHTLSEVVFICAWSAEVALCFDNYFTSPLGCAPRSAVTWYSELPSGLNRFGNTVPESIRGDAHTLCAYQRDLIGVVMVALLLYVTNLVISLFRIFEKVKVHQGWGNSRS